MTRTVQTGDVCPKGFPVIEHQSWVGMGNHPDGGFWRTDYKSCCPDTCVGPPGV